MATKMTLLAKFRNVFQNIEAVIKRIQDPPPGMFGAPALCFDTVPANTPVNQRTGHFPDLAALLEPIFYTAPRNRRSAEKRKTRKMTEYHFKPAVQKTNIVHCLTCGSPHERETICGACYEKVREETEALKRAMDQDTYYYDHPRKEVKYLYEDDDKTMYQNLEEKEKPYLVEVPRKRPEWFTRELVTKKVESKDSNEN